jgi:hypothetical protein
MSFSVSLYAVTPAELKKAREDNEHFGVIFGEDEDGEASGEAAAARLELADFTDTATLVRYAGYPTLHETFDFDASPDEEFEYSSYDIRVAAPATVKKIAGELASVTLERVREEGLAAEFRTDRTREEVTAEGYVEQFAEIERAREFFAAAAKAGHAMIAAGG